MNGATPLRFVRPHLVALVSALIACVGEVFGSIPPSQFHFSRIVPPDTSKEAGGWKAAQVIITLGDRYGVAACRVEVGVPERTDLGRITDQIAQQAAAEAADQAAHLVLGAGPNLSAIRCRRFIEEMNRLLKMEIPGARVSTFISAGLKATSWP